MLPLEAGDRRRRKMPESPSREGLPPVAEALRAVAEALRRVAEALRKDPEDELNHQSHTRFAGTLLGARDFPRGCNPLENFGVWTFEPSWSAG